jgi:DNA-3-methyladenine glycosylase II
MRGRSGVTVDETMTWKRKHVKDGLAHLMASDPVMAALIDRVGPFKMTASADHFRMLTRSICSQQISVAVAKAIMGRLEQVACGESCELTPERILKLPVETLRACGLSARKAEYVRALAQHVAEGRLPLGDAMHVLPDEEVIKALVAVRGIGVWTAQMFLMFSLARPDVLPHDDFGIRSGMQKLYRLKELPKRPAMDKIGRRWRPYATIACWYIWRCHELESLEGITKGSNGRKP